MAGNPHSKACVELWLSEAIPSKVGLILGCPWPEWILAASSVTLVSCRHPGNAVIARLHQRKEVLSELKNRVVTLTRSLEESRQENDALKADVVSLREENSFLRGMLSGTGRANELPANSMPRSVGVSRSGGVATPGGGTRSGGGAPGVSAVAGVVGTALAVISCVAISAAGSTDEGSAGSAALSSVHGVRMGGGRALLWMPVDDIAVDAEPHHGLRLSEVVGSAMPWSGLAVILISLAVYLLVDVAWRGRRSSRQSTC